MYELSFVCDDLIINGESYDYRVNITTKRALNFVESAKQIAADVCSKFNLNSNWVYTGRVSIADTGDKFFKVFGKMAGPSVFHVYFNSKETLQSSISYELLHLCNLWSIDVIPELPHGSLKESLLNKGLLLLNTDYDAKLYELLDCDIQTLVEYKNTELYGEIYSKQKQKNQHNVTNKPKQKYKDVYMHGANPDALSYERTDSKYWLTTGLIEFVCEDLKDDSGKPASFNFEFEEDELVDSVKLAKEIASYVEDNFKLSPNDVYTGKLKVTYYGRENDLKWLGQGHKDGCSIRFNSRVNLQSTIVLLLTKLAENGNILIDNQQDSRRLEDALLAHNNLILSNGYTSLLKEWESVVVFRDLNRTRAYHNYLDSFERLMR